MRRFPIASFAIPAIVILAVCILVAASPALHAWWVPDGFPVYAVTTPSRIPRYARMAWEA